MNFFKSFGYVTCAHALLFSQDLKLAHYVKIPPRQTFAAQMLGTFVSTFVSVGVLNFQINQIPNVCTIHAPNRFTCPYVSSPVLFVNNLIPAPSICRTDSVK